MGAWDQTGGASSSTINWAPASIAAQAAAANAAPSSDAISVLATQQRQGAALGPIPINQTDLTNAANFGYFMHQRNTSWQDASSLNWPMAYASGAWVIPGGSWASGGEGVATLNDADIVAAGGKHQVVQSNAGQADMVGWVFKQNPLPLLGRPGDPGAKTKYIPGEDTDWTGVVLVATSVAGGVIGGAYLGAGSAASDGSIGAAGGVGESAGEDIIAGSSTLAAPDSALDFSVVAPGADAVTTGAPVVTQASSVNSLWSTLSAAAAQGKEALGIVGAAKTAVGLVTGVKQPTAAQSQQAKASKSTTASLAAPSPAPLLDSGWKTALIVTIAGGLFTIILAKLIL